MTNEEWSACDSVESLSSELEIRTGSRKLRLFGAACLRRVWPLLRHEATRLAVEASEEYANGLISQQSLIDVWTNAELDVNEGLWLGPRPLGACGCWYCLEEELDQLVDYRRMAARVEEAVKLPAYSAALAAFHARELVSWNEVPSRRETATEQERRHQQTLLLDIIGPCPPSRFDPFWLCPNNGAVRRIAQAIYRDRDFNALLVLADALEDAGCTDATILDHCRESGDHVPGCWVIDRLLNKE